jgi:hypothetical protein
MQSFDKILMIADLAEKKRTIACSAAAATAQISWPNALHILLQRTLRPPPLLDARALRAGGLPLLLLTLPADAYSSSSSDRDTCKRNRL